MAEWGQAFRNSHVINAGAIDFGDRFNHTDLQRGPLRQVRLLAFPASTVRVAYFGPSVPAD